MHSPWVVGANTALLNVTAVVRLQSTQELSPGLCIPSSLRTNPKETFRSHPTSWWPLSIQSGRLAPPVLLPLSGGP